MIYHRGRMPVTTQTDDQHCRRAFSLASDDPDAASPIRLICPPSRAGVSGDEVTRGAAHLFGREQASGEGSELRSM